MAVWGGLAFGAFWILLTQLTVWLVGRNLPYSWYHRVDQDRRERNLWRLRATSLQALTDLRVWRQSAGGLGANKQMFADPRARELCVGIVSYSSGMERRLGQTLGSLLARAQDSSQRNVQITIFNAEDWPETHREAEALKDLVRVEALRPIHQHQYGQQAGGVPDRSLRATTQQMRDYATALAALEAQQCKRYLVLEDGAIAGKDWAGRVLSLARRNADERIAMVRMAASLQEVCFSWREPQDFTLILALAAVATLVVWVGSACLMRVASLGWYEAIISCHPAVLLLLLANFYLALLVLGKPNMPPIRTIKGLKPVDSHFLAAANFYPSQASLAGYRRVLEEHLMMVQRDATPSEAVPHDRLYPRLVEELSRETGQHYRMGVAVPSIFQSTVGQDKQTGDVESIPMSFDFGQDQVPVKFAPQPKTKVDGWRRRPGSGAVQTHSNHLIDI